MNIVFLDFDGVIVNPATCQKNGDTEEPYTFFDKDSCDLVKKLCEESNARIVISSSWRLHHSQDAIQSILNAVCSNLGYYLHDDWQTHHMDIGHRALEIREWLSEHPNNQFLILDDNPIKDNDGQEPYSKYTVTTDHDEGFTVENYEMAKEFFL